MILRFSHTYHPDECLRQVKEIINSKTECKNAVYKTPGNIAVRPIGELRGKVILVFDEKFNHHITPTEGIHRFRKYKEGLTDIDGLSTCGTFSSSMDMSKVHGGASSAAEKHLGHPADPGHLHFVYWQQTAKVIGEKNVLTTTTTPKKEGKAWTGGAHANLADFMDELQEMRKSEAKLPVNVISHDFVTSETCEKVIRLNPELKSA